MKFQIHTFAQLDSTSAALRRQAASLPFGTVYRARQQSAGYGRNGRSFYSPRNSGLYFSVLLPPWTPLQLTALAAVAMCRAIESLSELHMNIKWLNDLYLHGRKAGGILCESLYEDGKLCYLIMGIGLNVHPSSFPEPLRQSACALEEYSSAPLDEEKILERFLDEFSGLLEQKEDLSWMDAYRSRLLWKEQPVLAVQGQKAFEILLQDIAEDGTLQALFQGKPITLSSGEIHLLPL